MYLKKYLINILNFAFPFLSLISCNEKNKYSECSYKDTINYVSCIIYLNKNNSYIQNCITSNIKELYKNDFNFVVPKKDKCSNINKSEIYKYIMDPLLEAAQCFIDVKTKRNNNELFNCNKINNNINFEKRYKCYLNN